jgi:hypothetical protein
MAFVSNLWTYFKTPEPEKSALNETEEEKEQKIRNEEDEIVRRAETILRLRKEKSDREQQLQENQEKITKKVLQLISTIYQSKWKILFGNKAKVHLQNVTRVRDVYLSVMDKSKAHIEQKRAQYSEKVANGSMSTFHYYNLESQWVYKEHRQKQLLTAKNTVIESATEAFNQFIISNLDSILVSCSELCMYDIVRGDSKIMEFLTRSEKQAQTYKEEAKWDQYNTYFPEDYDVLHSQTYEWFNESYIATEFDIPYSASSYSRINYCCA